MKALGTLTIVALLFGCSTPSTRPIAENNTHCYWSTDGVRYNHFYLHLRPGGGYTIMLQGDITIWGEASGTWAQEGHVIRLSETSVKGIVNFPKGFKIQRDESLKFTYHGAGYSTGGTDLLPRRCDL